MTPLDFFPEEPTKNEGSRRMVSQLDERFSLYGRTIMLIM